MANILVTGASGFIGYHLLKALVARGDRVTCLVRKTSKLDRIEPLGVSLVYGDVTDYRSLASAVAGQEVVFHLAGLIKVLSREKFSRVNEGGVRNLVAACAAGDTPPVVVMVSSLAAAGPAPKGRLREETDPIGPVSHYGYSKRAGELAAEEHAHRMPITIVRPPIVFGEADRTCLKMFQTARRWRLHFVPTLIPHPYSFIHVDDLVRLLILAAERGERLPAKAENGDEPLNGTGYYFADSGEHPTYNKLGRLLGVALGRRFVLAVPSGPLPIWTAAAVSDCVGRLRSTPSLLSIDKAREARAGSWACSAAKAKRQLGFEVTVPLGERFRQTAEWYKAEGWL